jgi:hypothetical protein
MSWYDYQVSKGLARENYPFYALIMTAMRQADTDNSVLLQQAFPHIWVELQRRYNAPAGVLPGDSGEGSAHTAGPKAEAATKGQP